MFFFYSQFTCWICCKTRFSARNSIAGVVATRSNDKWTTVSAARVDERTRIETRRSRPWSWDRRSNVPWWPCRFWCLACSSFEWYRYIYIFVFWNETYSIYKKNVRKSHYDREKSSFFFFYNYKNNINRNVLYLCRNSCKRYNNPATPLLFHPQRCRAYFEKEKNFLSCCTPAKSVPLTVVWWPNRDKDKSYASLRRIFFFFFYDNYV